MALFGNLLRKLFRPVTKLFSWTMRKMGESFLSVSQKLKQADISYDSVLQARDIREALTEIDFYKEIYADINKTSTVPVNYMVEKDLNRPYNYRTAFEVTLLNTETGKENTLIASLYHDDNLSYNQLRQAYWDSVVKIGESPNIEDIKYYDYIIKDFSILTVWHQSGFPY